MTEPQANPTLPVEGGPQTAIPQTAIPHMGTSQASVAQPTVSTDLHAQAHTQQPAQQQSPTQTQPNYPPLPPGVTQDAINAAIKQVEQTGSTEGISPEIMAAACSQIEAQAKAQGIDIAQAVADHGTGTTPPSPPEHGAQTAVNDRQGTIDQFAEQRDSLRQQVDQQREALQQPINDALNKSGQTTSFDPETIVELAKAVKELDPQTIALINAVSAMSSNPSILNSVVWIEIVRTFRRFIAAEAKKQIDDAPITPSH